jgi:hypothetical protein
MPGTDVNGCRGLASDNISIVVTTGWVRSWVRFFMCCPFDNQYSLVLGCSLFINTGGGSYIARLRWVRNSLASRSAVFLLSCASLVM